jgi:hypothetical protein
LLPLGPPVSRPLHLLYLPMTRSYLVT